MGALGDFGDSLRLAIAIGMTVFMVVLRFDQERIMRSDYFQSRSRWMGPLSYYGLVLIFTAGIILILPRGRASLFLVGGDVEDLLPVMLAFAVIGIANGAALALLRFRALLPLPLEMLPSRSVAAGLNAVAEELQFRSVILGWACGLATVETGTVIPAMVGHFAVTMGIYAFAGARLRMQRI